jgi:integrase
MRSYPNQRELMARTGPGRFSAGDGLYLQVTSSGTRSWVFRYRVGDKQQWMGLGSARYLTLALAKQKAIDAQRLRLNGVDPLEHKHATRRRQAPAAASVTFKRIALQYIATHEAGWRGDRSRVQWTQSLQKYVFPRLASFPVSDIDTPRVLSVLEPIWTRIPESARRIRNRIELVLDYATAHGMRTGDNPARWRGLLDNLLPEQRTNGTNHLAAMRWRDLPQFMTRLRAQPDNAARALELGILTAARPGEILGARWSEFDLDAAVWVVPAERTKRNREHRVALSHRALELLKGLPRIGEFVFVGRGAGKPAPHTLVRLLARMGVKATAHGFRSSFKDWATEATKYPDIVAEQALAHQVGGAVERAYRRGDLLDQRRRLMQDWADFCDRLHAEGAHE